MIDRIMFGIDDPLRSIRIKAGGFIPPTTMAQSRRHTVNGSFRTTKGKAAMMKWRRLMHIHTPAEPLDGCIILRVALFIPHTRESRRLCKRLGVDIIPKLTRPDLDNMLKDMIDAMTHERLITDDSRVFAMQPMKFHADPCGVHISLDQVRNDMFSRAGVLALIHG